MLVSKTERVNEVILVGKELLNKASSSPFYYCFCFSLLEEEWKKVNLLIDSKTLEIKKFKSNWILFHQELNFITENFTKIKTELSKSKSKQLLSQASIDKEMRYSLVSLNQL